MTIVKMFRVVGLELIRFIPGFRNPQTGQLQQADGVFVNRHLASK
jgi:hypothetical protein